MVRNDDGPEYSSLDFSMFASSYRFTHITISQLYPQINDFAERMVYNCQMLIEAISRSVLGLDELSFHSSTSV